MQTGTVSVERIWATLLDWLPPRARSICFERWQVLALLIFVRFNAMQFQSGALPNLCRGDSLLSQHLDVLLCVGPRVADLASAQHLQLM